MHGTAGPLGRPAVSPEVALEKRVGHLCLRCGNTWLSPRQPGPSCFCGSYAVESLQHFLPANLPAEPAALLKALAESEARLDAAQSSLEEKSRHLKYKTQDKIEALLAYENALAGRNVKMQEWQTWARALLPKLGE